MAKLIKKQKWNEIRLDDEGKNDDIVIDCDTVHLEQLDNNCWWLGVYKGNKRTTFILLAQQSGVECQLQDNELKTKIVPWKKK